jgi:ABC-type uncharacterized transport system YnjBCD permease subunit
MLKKFLAASVLLAMTAPAAMAAPASWYDVDLTWRDGAFTGRMLYDGSTPSQVLQVDGTLTTTAQTTSVTDVWQISQSVAVSDEFPLSFTNWNDPADPLNYNAAFYLVLADLGTSLGLVVTPGSALGLYDWSNDALFDENHLSNSPLLSWSISPVAAVPEPTTWMTMLAGLAGLGMLRRRARSR